MNKRIIISESEKKHIKSIQKLDEQDWVTAILNKYGKEITSGEKNSGDEDINSNDSSNTNIKASDTFDKVTDLVIKKFEGGYWNPYCPNHPKGNMGKSTETMFGLDRYNGNIESTDDGKKFFSIIDKLKKEKGAFRVGKKWFRMGEFCKTWTHGFKGGDKETVLKQLTIDIMRKNYEKNSSSYFTPELKKRVEKSPGLTLHFSYATWNGPGFFKKFAKSMSNKLSSHPNMSEKELIDSGIADRGQTGLLGKEKVAAAMRDKNLINTIS